MHEKKQNFQLKKKEPSSILKKHIPTLNAQHLISRRSLNTTTLKSILLEKSISNKA